tara:strand:- start:151 stop:453 length:303 start_codon:yes stop_codon:yes gene_type:complete
MKKQLEITTVNMKIYVRNNDISKAYRILNKKLHAEGFFKEIREKQFFKSKSEKRRDALRAARARWEKKKKLLDVQFEKQERNLFKYRKKQNQQKVKIKKS